MKFYDKNLEAYSSDKSIFAVDNLKEANEEIERLKGALAWLADCSAGTAEALKARTSKADRIRHSTICEKAALFLNGHHPPPGYKQKPKIDDVIDRCFKVSDEQKNWF